MGTKIWYKWTYLQTELEYKHGLTDTENKLTATKGESGGGYIGNLGYTLLHIK